ncbi:hypothetical protein WEN_00415 [Mycoplasma wenyonii str. Massachusetts]|uniref:Uncharacterized protein n=1 Tax=Mycoplasma wenyonii (strain Massachusetts) TaxID=1197325 RepID=I6ZI94_MYCWM|nr:hypothetical protein [Mycoplasma wenyonii]AFN64890.1 hypothetical protein WEN_00415 [Mycoplasma wenyonii str. Massachusetts]
MSLLKLFHCIPGCAAIACPFVHFGKAFESGGEWWVPGAENITVFRTESDGRGGKFFTYEHVKAGLGLVGKKKHKNNGLDRIAIVDFKNIKVTKNSWSDSLKGAVKIAQKINSDKRKDEFQDVNDGISWKFLGVEGEQVVGYMLVARLSSATGKPILESVKGSSDSVSSESSKALELKDLVKREDDKPVCQNRAKVFDLMLTKDFSIEWRDNSWKLGVISPEIVGQKHKDVIQQMKATSTGCQDGQVFFVTSNVYFWLKNGHDGQERTVFSEENQGSQFKALKVKDTVKSVIYDNIENIELTLNGLKDSFGHTMSWGEGSKPIVNLQIKR